MRARARSSTRAAATVIAIAIAIGIGGLVVLTGTVPLHLPSPTDYGLPAADAEEVGMSSERLERLDHRIRDYIDRDLIAGAVTLVAREGQVVHLEAQGYRNREEGVPMEADDIFVIMSMTKPIAATALLMLHEEGHFLLSDPVSNWLPELQDLQVRATGDNGDETLEPARPITVRDALMHATGLTSSGDGSVEPVEGDSPLRARVRQLSANPLNFQPGSRWAYTNGGISSDVVAALVEEISGRNMDEFLRERLFEPLGMRDTHYNVPEEDWDRRARLYQPNASDGGRISPRPVTRPAPTDRFLGLAGLSSTAPDYFRFAQMILNGGEYDGVRLLSPKTISLMITNHLPDGEGVNLRGPGYGFGLGVSMLTDPGSARESLTPGSFGWGGAYGTYYFTDPVEEVVGILMIQLSSYGHLNIRQDVGTLAMQAITEARSAGDATIAPYVRLE